MDRTMTPDEVAQDLQLSRYTVLQHLRSGHILGGFQVVPGGPWRVDVATYAAWRAERARPSDDPERIDPRSPRSRAAHDRRPRRHA